MHPKTREKLILTVVGWGVAFLIFFPIFWMILTSFKTEIDAVSTPPQLFFKPTLENYTVVRERADYVHFAMNSVIISVGATLLATLIAVPSSYAMAFFPVSGPRICCCGCCPPR
jgi:sorbitol/mannitol transport system permease protein